MSIHLEAHRFRTWASSYPSHGRSGEWECDYTDWASIYAAVTSLLNSDDRCGRLTEDDLRTLLYLLARDNECEVISAAISKRPDLLIRLAHIASHEGEPEAIWQLSHALGSIDSCKADAETLLIEFVHHPDEYVSRRALLALGEIRSTQTEALARRAWNTGLEYQRIAALWALKSVQSDLLAQFVEAALEDGREFVVLNAQEVCDA